MDDAIRQQVIEALEPFARAVNGQGQINQQAGADSYVIGRITFADLYRAADALSRVREAG